MARLGELVEAAAARLKASGIENPRADARLLIAAALGCGRESLLAYPERPVPEEGAAAAARYIARRAGREPVSRILAEREFWSLPFAVTPAVLDPRGDSETLVEAV